MTNITTAPESAIALDGMKTTSLIVAEAFGKRHDNLISAIESLDVPRDYHLLNFKESIRRVSSGKGAVRKFKTYEITRDGFSLLVMGFTGKKAMGWKIKFLEAFNAMEASLSQSAALPPQTLSPASQLKLRKAVADKAQGSRLAFSAIYQSLYTHFQVAKYDQIRESDLSAALAFIQGLEIKVPELAAPSAGLNLGVKVDYSAPASHESITSGLYRLSQALAYKGQGDAAYICEGAMELLSYYYSQIEQIRLLIAGNAARNRSAI